MSLPILEAWIEVLPTYLCLYSFLCRFLYWKRGLKLEGGRRKGNVEMSLPILEAWIEVQSEADLSFANMVASYTGSVD